jgi:hypothetical protein
MFVKKSDTNVRKKKFDTMSRAKRDSKKLELRKKVDC